jgi:hypothetical protein
MCEWNNGGLPVNLPENICTWKDNRIVCIDECIITQIKILWENGYETLGCCCGHGKEAPSVIVGEGYGSEDITNIYRILSECDARKWKIFQWKLQEVKPADAEGR